MILRLLGGIVLLLAVAMASIWFALRASLPPTEGEVSLPGLNAPAEVRFDQWQRPYVQAATLGDALQIQGWLHASHRLWQMELLRRAGSGRMAELLGPDLVDTDKELWRVGVPQLAARLEQNASAQALVLLDAYLSGVNAAIDQYPLLPPEFLLLRAERPLWRRSDVFALGALMAYQSANNMSHELLRLALSTHLDTAHYRAFARDDSGLEAYPFVLNLDDSVAKVQAAGKRLALLDPLHNRLMPRLGFGSNGWVVASHRSATGTPLFAFDSHDELGLPNLFYEVHLFYGAGRQLRGWSVAGLPGVINGFNADIAWGFTNIGDSQDLFIEQRSLENPLLFRDGPNWYRASTELITIPVAGGQPEQLEIVHTRNGPLISDDPPISLAWTVQRMESPSLDSLFAFNQADNWAAFTAALDEFPAPTVNATYADVHGTIGFRTGGVLPRRGAGEGRHPQSGADPEQRWRGMVPASAMPERANPPDGILAAANARVQTAGNEPLVSADNAAPYRIQRIRDVLSDLEQVTAADMQDLQMDWIDGQAQMLLPAMLSATATEALDARAKLAFDLLLLWADNPRAETHSGAALVFQHWYLALAERVFADKLGTLWPDLLRFNYVLNQALDPLIMDAGESVWWAGDKSGLVSAALMDSVSALALQLGGDPSAWRLDQRQTVTLEHELGKAVPALAWLFNRPGHPWGGSAATVGRAGYSYRRPNVVKHGATVRAVAVMQDPPKVFSIIPGGQSGHPLSEHYADQFAGWLAGELYPIPATFEEVTGSRMRVAPDAVGAPDER